MTKAKNSAFNKIHFEENKTMHRNYNSNHDISRAFLAIDEAHHLNEVDEEDNDHQLLSFKDNDDII